MRLATSGARSATVSGTRLRLAAGCVLLLLASACGSRLPDDVLESIDAGRSSGGAAQAASSQSQNGEATAPDVGAGAAGGGSTAAVGATGGRGGAAGASASGGTRAVGGGTSGSTASTTASRCADAKSAAPGVTDDEIKVASIVTDSGPLPGATEGSFRGAAAYFAMVNANGGVCGRKITLLKGDDGLDPAKGRGEFLRLEPQVFAFTGSFSVADSGYIDLIAKSKVPWVSIVVEPEGREARNVMPRTATGMVSTGPFEWLKRTHPKLSRTAVLYADVGGVSANVGGFEAALKRAGWNRVYTSPAEVTTPDYTPEVRQAQDQNIEFFYLFAFEVNMHVRMVRNMRQQNYDPPIKGSNIAFNTRFSQLLGRDGDGWQNHQTHLLFLDPRERTRSADLAKFLDWNERVFPGAQLDLFPVSGWGRAALFVQALQKIEGTITREALVNALYTIKTFNGGGIETTVDPTTGLGEGCWNMAVHSGGRWVRQYPTNTLFECDIGETFKWQ
jgi:branched-chain amino acid transport system substrate-binding protein